MVLCKPRPIKQIRRVIEVHFYVCMIWILTRGLARWSLQTKTVLHYPPPPSPSSLSQLSSPWDQEHQEESLNACLPGMNRLVLPTEYIQVHGSDIFHYKCMDLPVQFANTNIYLRDHRAFALSQVWSSHNWAPNFLHWSAHLPEEPPETPARLLTNPPLAP